jgi:iron complex outermembrane receptor protein
MKKSIAIALLAGVSSLSIAQSNEQKTDSLKTLNLDEVFVNSTRANDKTPVTFTNVKKEAIKAVNLGQDLPILLKMTPSLVTTSDAGAGIGYTGMRIRGSDATRINVTINGIPINDSESQGVFWVNMPDLSSSTNSIQIQRGVGTSTNGAAAFGATVNLQTSTPATEAYGMINNTVGSFGTRKHTVMLNSGLIDDRWAFEGRLSKIASDGFIDRSAADLQSYFLSSAYYGKKTIIKALAFGGKEVTQQAWYGTPEAKLIGTPEALQDLIGLGGEYSTLEQLDNLNNADARTFNYYTYDNQVDNYQQDHYQLHLSHQFNNKWNATVAGHYTYGRGYFEQFRSDDAFEDYNLPNVQIGAETITSSDIIRRRWLDNNFAGFTYSLNYEGDKINATLGGGYNYYDGDHFGEIIWAQYAGDVDIRDRYYDNVGTKNDFNSFIKVNYQVTDNLNLFVDAQMRVISYQTTGIDNDLRPININEEFNFFNPKFGATYQLDEQSNLYGSFAIGNREPVRSDFLDSPVKPRHETLQDIEIGYKRFGDQYELSFNIYNMNYQDQLVLTGELDDVGNSVRANVDNSYRRGTELEGTYQFSSKVAWGLNAAFSQNKIKDFTEVLYDYGDNFDEFNIVNNEFENTDISFSPNVVVGSILSYMPIKGLSIGLQSKYVGQQFLDNTSNNDRAIEAYFINDLNLGYTFKTDFIKEIGLQLLVNNILDIEYESNGYTWGYLAGSTDYRQNNYYPQAGTNFLLAMNLKF